MNETYIKVKGKWCYLYRAVDKEGNTVEFLLTKNRDKVADKAFFDKAICAHDTPEKVTIDKSGSNKSALDAINLQLASCTLLPILIRQIKYLNNIVEQDHRGIKRITKSMMGFKSFSSAQSTIAGIELHRMLRKKQHIDAANQTVFEQFFALAG